jgi:hypothetical protein
VFPSILGPVWIRTIQEQLNALRAADRSLSLPGASSHRYANNPPLSEAQVREFEERFQVRLPDDYRDYLLAVGNGGAGPDFGVFRLGFHADGHDRVRWEQGRDVGTLSAPFPFSQPWNLPAGFWPKDEEDAEAVVPDGIIEASARELERVGVQLHRDRIGRLDIMKNPFTRQPIPVTLGLLVMNAYYSPALLNGCIPVNTEGCNLSGWLVVTGPERGNVWRDLRADYEGIAPAESASAKRLTFREWYAGWIDEYLATVSRRTSGRS